MDPEIFTQYGPIGLLLILLLGGRKAPAVLASIVRISDKISAFLDKGGRAIDSLQLWLDHELGEKGIAAHRKSDPEQVVRLHQGGRIDEIKSLLEAHDTTDTLPRELRKLIADLSAILPAEPTKKSG